MRIYIRNTIDNKKQHDVIHQWAREFVKNKSGKVPTKIGSLHIFIRKYRLSNLQVSVKKYNYNLHSQS